MIIDNQNDEIKEYAFESDNEEETVKATKSKPKTDDEENEENKKIMAKKKKVESDDEEEDEIPKKGKMKVKII